MKQDEWLAVRIHNGLASGELVRNTTGEVVCSQCMGNCGQCGLTDIIGNHPVSMQALISGLNKARPKPMDRSTAQSAVFAAMYGGKPGFFKRITNGVSSWLAKLTK